MFVSEKKKANKHTHRFSPIESIMLDYVGDDFETMPSSLALRL
jgi:hypothetical protein